jgi:tRNA(Ile)-lysidine synthase
MMRSTAVEAAVRHALAGVPPGRTIVAALSGGPDSVALLDALATAARASGLGVVAAHLDHRLRDGSAADAAFCARLCERLGVPLRTASADVRGRARREGGGLEQAARRARYAFLRAVKAEAGAHAIAIAHTRDDQAETVLMRLLRGSGRTGLGAMRPRSAGVLRPLLGVSRADVIAHLRHRGLTWREDPTNSDTRILRNRVRHELIPYLEARFNPSVRGALARAASVLAAEQDLLDSMAAELMPRVARLEAGRAVIDRAALAAAPEALARLVVRRCLRAAGGLRGVARVHVERLLALARARGASGRRLALPGRREAVVRFGELWIRPAAPAWDAFEAALAVPGRVVLPDGSVLTARRASGPGAVEGCAVVAVADEPLVVRTRRPGDRVRSAGRERSLKRLLLEGRVPADERQRLPLVAAGGRVIWFPGLRPDPRAAARGTGYVALALEPAAAAAGARA